jgi:hypothetical protein
VRKNRIRAIRSKRERSTVAAIAAFAVLLAGCGGPGGKADDIQASFAKSFPEADFAVTCRDDLGPDSSIDFDCNVLWAPRDQKLTVRETYEWQKRFQRHDLRDYKIWQHLLPGVVSGNRIVPVRITCRDVPEGHGGFPAFELLLAYPESHGPPGANFASSVDRQMRNFRRHHCAFSSGPDQQGG